MSMKTKKLNKKLELKKTTVVTLHEEAQQAAKGGYWQTALYTNCYSWHPVCPTQPVYYCSPLLTEELDCYAY